LATVRGRVGVLPTQSLLLYATGGAAFAGINTSDFAFFAADGSSNAASSDKTKTGWTVGAGAEWALSGGWSVKAEYLYVDLGNISYTSSNSSPANPLATINHDHRIVENIGRVGVNYRFNAGPVVAKY
jgi:outer membrane immunogenic protein